MPQGEQLRGLLNAILRLQGFADAEPDYDRQLEILGAFLADGTKTGDPAIDTVLELAEHEVLPKLLATADEIPALIGGLHGRHVVAGPSGSPTRGRLDVLPTGRNMYSVDPRALPSDLAYETGTKLADALLASHDELPETVGIVVWGTAAMRTAGDDAGEILALLGVRPKWHPETRRIVGLDVIPLEELGRPRIDVTVRISGFFRDAFPHLVDVLDDAVTLVAGLDEPEDQNFVRKHVLADVEELAGDWQRRHRAHLRRPPGHVRHRHPAARGRQELARRRRPRRGLRGLGRARLRPRAAAASRRAARCGASSRASTSRSRTSTRASTTCSTARTTSPSTAG